MIEVGGSVANKDASFTITVTGDYRASYSVTLTNQPFTGELRIYSGDLDRVTAERDLPNRVVLDTLTATPPGKPTTGDVSPVHLTSGTWQAGLYGFQDVGADPGSLSWKVFLSPA
jgi:hypothetical protein